MKCAKKDCDNERAKDSLYCREHKPGIRGMGNVLDKGIYKIAPDRPKKNKHGDTGFYE